MSMSRSNEPDPRPAAKRAVALQYGVSDRATVVVASGMGCLAEKIVDVAHQSGVPIYEDNSLATILSQLELGQEIPEELYRAVVEIYVYFLNFDPNDPTGRGRQQAAQPPAQDPAPAPPEGAPSDTKEEAT